MNIRYTLTHHRDIQNWVAQHKGVPAIRRSPNQFGELRARLALQFSRPRPAPTSTPSQDDGISPVSWTAWLAELDRQHLALRVFDNNASRDPDAPEFEFVERREIN